MGTTYIWNNAAGGGFGVQGNWTPNGVPGSVDTAVFNLGGTSYTVSGDGTPGYVLINSDTVTFNGSIQAVGLPGQYNAFEIGGAGAAIFDGGTLDALSEVMVGDGTGDGTLDFIDSATGTLTATDAASALDIGFYGASNDGGGTPSTGTVLVDNSTLNILGGFYVGVFSAGTMTITDDALVQVTSSSAGFDTLEIGVNDASVSGLLTVDDGATLNLGIDSLIGVYGNGTLAVAGNATVTGNNATVAAGAGSTGSIDVDNASLTLNGDLSTGAGTSTITVEDSGGIAVTGTVIIGGGGGAALVQLTDFAGLYAYDAGITIAALGTLALDGSAYLDSGDATLENQTTGTLTLDGGTLVALDTDQIFGASIDVAGGTGAQPSTLLGSDLLMTGGITFVPGAPADLLLGPAINNGSTFYGFAAGDTLDVQITGTVYNSASYDAATQQLVLSDGSGDTTALNIADTGNYAADSFVAIPDGPGGTDVLLSGTVYDWINPAGGSFTTAANWNPTGIPGAADSAEFLIPDAYTVSGDGVAGYILVQDAVTFTGSIEAAGLSDDFTAFQVGDGGAATFNGGTLYSQLEARIGDQTGSGSVAFTNGAGGTLTATNTATALDIGFADAPGVTTSGTVSVTGPGTTLTLLGGAYVGVDGTGTLAIANHALVRQLAIPVSYNTFEVGVDSTASGTVTVTTGSTLDLGETAVIGVGGHGSLEAIGGSTVDSVATTGHAAVILGGLMGAVGTAFIDDSLWTITGKLVIGDAGAGTLDAQDGAVLSLGTSDLSIGQDLGGNGLLTIGGSTLHTSGLLTVGPDIDSGNGAVGGSGTLELYGVNVSSQASVGSGLIAGLAGGTGSIDVQDNGLTFYGSLTTGAGTSIVTLEDGGGGIGVVGDLVIGGGGTAPGQGVADFAVRDGGQITDFSGITLAALGTLGIDATSFIHNEGANGITLNGGTLDALGSAGFGYNVTVNSALQITGGTTAQPSALIGTAGSDLTITGGITFDGPAVLLLGTPYNTNNEINDFASGDTLDIAGQIYNTASYNVVAQQLTLTEGPDPLVLDIADNGYSADSFSAYTDGNGGTDVSLGPPPCYLAGTRIATPDGERRVEDLRPGDRVTLAGGGHARLIWVGQRRLDPTTHPRAWEVLPIRIRRDALAAGLPRRDLLVSPDHALLLDGVLVEAKRLVNGRTIVQEAGLRSVHYFHLELARHDILLAEGVAAESYLDTGNRRAFADADAPLLHPSFAAPRAAASCAPFATDPHVVRPIWQRLAERAAPPADTRPATADPAARLHVNGRLIAPLHAEPGRLCFALPPGARRLRLVSRAAQPAWRQPWLDDRRTLGLDVARIRLRAQGAVTDLPLDGPHLAGGWWDVERDGTAAHRWTNGDAAITLPFAAETLELVARPLEAYPVAPAVAGNAARHSG